MGTDDLQDSVPVGIATGKWLYMHIPVFLVAVLLRVRGQRREARDRLCDIVKLMRVPGRRQIAVGSEVSSNGRDD